VKQEIDEELRFHLEQRTAENVVKGMSPEDAAREARKRFGNIQSVREECRAKRGANFGETTWQDVRFGLRMLRKNPGFTAVAVLSLALGIGAATAVFSLVNAILLRSLPVPNPQELRVLQWTGVDARPRSISGQVSTSGNRATAECVSPSRFFSLREQGAGLADIFAFAPLEDAVARARHEAFPASGMVVSDNFFSALGVRPAVGRLFAPGDAGAGGSGEVVITFEQWERHFSRDPGVVGQSLTFNGHSLTIIGVLPRGFSGVQPGKPRGFYVLLTAGSPFGERAVSVADHWWVRLMARLQPDVTDARLAAALNTAFVPEAESQMKQPEILVQPGGGGLAFDRNAYGKPLLLVLAVIGLVLLVACANIAGLLLARGAARQHELAVRAALGAGRWRIVRQSLTESLLLALLGGGLGVLIATQGRTIIARLLAPSANGLRYDFSLDLTVLAFAFTVALVTALLSGLLPALRAGNADPLSGLKARTALGMPRLRAGRVLVVAQIGLSLVLLSGAGLYLRTLLNLRQIDAGFDTEKLLVFQLNPGFAGYQETQLTAFYNRVQASLSAIPGVQGASLTVFPLLDNKSSSGGFAFKSRPMGPNENPQTFRLVVGETFFATLGLSVLRGRGLSAADADDASKVIVVNEAFARKYFPNDGDPLGHTINTWRADWRIVGVCQDAKYENIRDVVPPTIYIPFRQFPLRYGAYFAVRTALPPMALANAVRKSVAAIDPNVPVANLTTQDQLISGTISQERLLATLCGALAAFALVLACIGLYGLLSFNVARRTNEIGVRMAIGAQPWDVARVILREAMLLAAIGVGFGLPMAFAVTRLIRSQLYGVQPNDPMTLFVVTTALIAVAGLAAWLPARRAARVNPMIALRHE
jgi:predicted permease